MTGFKYCRSIVLAVFFLIFFTVVSCGTALAATDGNTAPFILDSAVMCSRIRNFKPENPAVVFSISEGEVFCYSSFDRIKETCVIYHQWYRKDKLISTIRLTLTPPKWASFSSIKIRNADKGPWRVEIRDADNRLIDILRFSMAD